MLKNFLLAASIFLCGCSYNEYKGHYKIDEKKIQKGMSKNEVIAIFGTPITFSGLDDVFYYSHSKNRISSFGVDKTKEAKIIRFEFKNDVLVLSEIFEYQDFSVDKQKTKAPEMKISIMFEVIDSIGKVTGVEEGKERIEKSKTE